MTADRKQHTVIFLDPKRMHIERDPFQDLTLVLADGPTFRQVQVLQALPLSKPGSFVEFRTRDDQEIGFLRDLGKLDRKSRRLLEAELEKVHFVPVITRILRLERAHPGSDWSVETDRGRRQFKLRGRRESRSIGGGRMLLKDIEGNKYLIRDHRRLDPRSQKLLEEFM